MERRIRQTQPAKLCYEMCRTWLCRKVGIWCVRGLKVEGGRKYPGPSKEVGAMQAVVVRPDKAMNMGPGLYLSD